MTRLELGLDLLDAGVNVKAAGPSGLAYIESGLNELLLGSFESPTDNVSGTIDPV